MKSGRQLGLLKSGRQLGLLKSERGIVVGLFEVSRRSIVHPKSANGGRMRFFFSKNVIDDERGIVVFEVWRPNSPGAEWPMGRIVQGPNNPPWGRIVQGSSSPGVE